MATLKIDNGLHFRIKKYCIFHELKIETFTENLIKDFKPLLAFEKGIEEKRFK